jgi:hypothetical protein
MPLRQAQGKLSRQPAGPFGFAQGKLLRLRSGQAPSASLRASSFGFAQGKLPALLLFSAVKVASSSFRRYAARAARVPRHARSRVLPA